MNSLYLSLSPYLYTYIHIYVYIPIKPEECISLYMCIVILYLVAFCTEDEPSHPLTPPPAVLMVQVSESPAFRVIF